MTARLELAVRLLTRTLQAAGVAMRVPHDPARWRDLGAAGLVLFSPRGHRLAVVELDAGTGTAVVTVPGVTTPADEALVADATLPPGALAAAGTEVGP